MKKLNDKIGLVLREYRRKNALSVSDVSIRLQDQFHLKVAEKTIYGWESNQAHPTTDVFLLLCHIYGIQDLSDSFGTEWSNDFPLSQDERDLISSYRAQDSSVQIAVRRVLGMST